MDNTEQFCRLVRERSIAHKKAIHLLSGNQLAGQMMSILRQELDSMVRVIFLLTLDLGERNHLIQQTLSGQRWRLINNSIITDKQMVDLADRFNGWTQSVYKFGCAFIHLSSFHDYGSNDPFKTLLISESNSIKTHLNTYHGFSLSHDLTMENVARFLPMIFDKISDNLEWYIQTLERKSIPDINYL